MNAWPRSLRMRLILVLTLAMVVTQVVVVLAVAEVFGREQRIERAQQMARFVNFIKPRVEALPDVKLDEQLNLRPTRRREGGPGDPGGPPGERAGGPPPAPPDGMPMKPPPKPGESGGPPGPPGEKRSPFRDMMSIVVTAQVPSEPGDPELLKVLRAAAPDVVAVRYTDVTKWPAFGPNRAYLMETWTEIGAGRYLKTTLDDSKSQDTRGAKSDGSAFATFDIGLRIGVGVALALIIMSWISKPLSRLAESADATLPSGELKPGAPRLSADDAPTEIAHTLAAFDRMRLRIGAMVQERTTMLTALAHDLRTPITRLMLRLELANDPKLRDEAYRDCEKMQALITRTLDFIRSTESGQLAAAPVDLHAVLMQAIAGLAPSDQRRIVFAGESPATLPHVSGNALGIERAIANVLENALKYSPDDKQVEVRLTHATATQVMLAIADHGPGVAPELLPRLREPFFRVDVARNMDEGGAGLGLSIVDNLVRAYGGEVEIANRDGGGLLVSLRLPSA